MRGIAAVMETGDAPADEARLQEMMAAMPYRTANGTSVLVRSGMALGQMGSVRVATLAQGDRMLACLFDGYLHNVAELRAALAGRGGPPASDDADLALAAFAAWGEEAAVRLEGEFAALWADLAERRIVCARDHAGLRPLAYAWDGRRLVVASDIAAVLAGLDRAPPLNAGYIAQHIANEWLTRDETPWAGVSKLPGAHRLALRHGQGGPNVTEYWQPGAQPPLRCKTDRDYAESYRAMLSETVKRCAVSAAPVASEVSGGLDSSAITALLVEAQRAGRLAAPGVLPFALCGPTGDPSDERRFFRAVAAHLDWPVTEIPLFEPDAAALLEQGEHDRTLAFPPNAQMLVPMLAAMREAGATVCLTGQGGDEWLTGRERHLAHALRERDWRGFARGVRAEWADRGVGRGSYHAFRYGIAPLAPGGLKRVFSKANVAAREDDEHPSWLSAPLREELAQRRESERATLAEVPEAQRDAVAQLRDAYSEYRFEMLNLLGARAGVEYRHPMMSRAFIGFNTATPPGIRQRGTVSRFVHREAMRGLLPDLVRRRETKAFFDSTFQRLDDAMERFCLAEGDQAPFAGWVDDAGMRALFKAYRGAPFDQGAIWELWGCYSAAAFGRQVRTSREG